MANLRADRKPRKLLPDTPAKIQKILKDISLGSPYKIAAEANGLSEAHLYNLITQGTNDLAAEKDTLQSRMVESLRAIEQKEIQECIADIKGREKGNRGSEWILERRYWKYFGSNVGLVEVQAQLDELKNQIAQKNKNENKEINDGTSTNES